MSELSANTGYPPRRPPSPERGPRTPPWITLHLLDSTNCTFSEELQQPTNSADEGIE